MLLHYGDPGLAPIYIYIYIYITNVTKLHTKPNTTMTYLTTVRGIRKCPHTHTHTGKHTRDSSPRGAQSGPADVVDVDNAGLEVGGGSGPIVLSLKIITSKLYMVETAGQ